MSCYDTIDKTSKAKFGDFGTFRLKKFGDFATFRLKKFGDTKIID